MRKWLILSLISSFIILNNLFSQSNKVTFHGNNSDYAGEELEFIRYYERIFDTYQSLAKTKVDSSGDFSVSFTINQTECIYCNTAFYRSYIYAEPGKTYKIDLPDFSTDNTESNNPFFIPPLWHLMPLSDTRIQSAELNAAIFNFDREYEPFLDRQIVRYYNPAQSKEKLDSFQIAIKANELTGNEYLDTYISYKIAVLRFMVRQFSHNELYQNYIRSKPPRPDVPSWWEFFNLYYDGYFSSLYTKSEFRELYSYIGNGEYYSLNLLLKKDSALQNSSIREWLILKELQVGYYENGLPLQTLNAICDSISKNSEDPTSLSIAKYLKKEASALLRGNLPPAALLHDSNGETLETTALKGKYTYLSFCSVNNLECQQEFEYLKYFYHNYGKYLDLIVILPESEKEDAIHFSEENSIPWKFWFAKKNSTILKDYKVRAYPVFYLLDKEGKLNMSPAPSPSAGFDRQLFGILRSSGDI